MRLVFQLGTNPDAAAKANLNRLASTNPETKQKALVPLTCALGMVVDNLSEQVAVEVQEDLLITEIQDKAEQVVEAMELSQSQEQQVQELPILAVAVVEKMVLTELEVGVTGVQAW